MNTDRNGFENDYDLATVRSDIAAINATLLVHSSQLSSLEHEVAKGAASVAELAAKFEVLEDSVATLKVDVEVIRSNYATKADLANLEAQMARMETGLISRMSQLETGLITRMSQLETGLLKWFISTWLAMAGTTFAIVKFVH
jgi:chromosome segregation ATPase